MLCSLFVWTGLCSTCAAWIRACSITDYEGFVTDLEQFTQLQELWLTYTTVRAAFEDALIWCALPNLSKLSIGVGDRDCCMNQAWCGSLIHGLKYATALTHLALRVRPDGVSLQALDLGGPFGSVGCLTRLCHLSLNSAAARYVTFDTNGLYSVVAFNPREAEQLSTLQQLTHMELAGCGQAVGDAVAVSLGLSLSELRTLVLHNCELRTDAVLPVLKRMRHLAHVDLSDNPFVHIAGFEAAAASGMCPWLVGYSSSAQPAAVAEGPIEGGQLAEAHDSDSNGSI